MERINSLLPPQAGASAASDKFPEHWGSPPEILTMDYVPLAGGYGHGSSGLFRPVYSPVRRVTVWPGRSPFSSRSLTRDASASAATIPYAP